MKRKSVALFCVLLMLFSIYSVIALANAEAYDGKIIEDSYIPLRLWYDEEASHGINDVYENASESFPVMYEGPNAYDGTMYVNDDWERWSLPIGNGYFGANVFGRTETERIQISEKTIVNPYYRYEEDGTKHSLGGLNSFSETYIDFGHVNSEVSDYSRWLDLETAISGVSYEYNDVTYTREYFTSYPDKVLVIRLDASKTGELNFTLRPTIPWEQSYAAFEGDGASKEGTVTSTVVNGIGEIELAGNMGYYDIDFLGLYRVYTNGGTISASTAEHTYTDTANVTHNDINGTIVVKGATSAYIYVTLGTDYELSEEVFTSPDSKKPTTQRTLEYTREKVSGYMDSVLEKMSGKSLAEAYNTIKNAHVTDYSELFSRVTLNLGSLEDANLTTDELLSKYQNGNYSPYLEALYFQYGRYLLIASSREGALPANLQGVWNRYNFAPWASSYTHNINLQMNYWPAFNTNLGETFDSYLDYAKAYMHAAEMNATSIIDEYYNTKSGLDGGDGWCMGYNTYPNSVQKDRSAGNLGFTTQLFWEYYVYTRDPEALEYVYDVLISAARFITKIVELDEEGNYLVSYCDSPEIKVNGVLYFTVGTTYAQSFAYVNNYNALAAAKALGIDFTDTSNEDYAILNRILEQIDKYDPIHVGLSGQIKEFREEDYFGSIGDDPLHRHTSQLVGLYPGNLINSSTEAWLDAAAVTLTNRGDESTGWGLAFRLCHWARIKDGENSYHFLNKLLGEFTATNLWDLCPPFQIDGNLGGTAAITEMLLQSHEGYIDLLPAIPEAWSEGSYTGLVARGNFEVSAKWRNGVATVFNITSNVGERVSLHYSGITSSTVTTVSGAPVNYDVTGKDMISFDTKRGETYIVYGFTVPKKVNNVPTISATRVSFDPISISWSEASGAVGYNLYVAIDNDASYTLLASTTDNIYVYTPSEKNINSRFTFKVKAFDNAGNESKGTICYVNPSFDPEIYEETPYGYINKEQYPAEEYPFVLFDDGGRVLGAYDSWLGFLRYGASKVTEKSYLVLRGDYTTGTTADQKHKSEKSGCDRYLYNIKAHLTIDLMGHTIARGSNHLFQIMSNGNNFSFTVKNGYVRSSTSGAAVYLNDTGSNGRTEINITFEKVTFLASATTRPVLDVDSSGSGYTANVMLNDCTIDAVGNTKTGIILFDMDDKGDKDTTNKFDIKVAINGGKLLADATSISNLTYATFDSARDGVTTDSITLGNGSDGKEFYMELPSSAAHPTAPITTTTGTLYPVENADDGTKAIYYYESNVTEYGAIGTAYLSSVDYPFVLFSGGNMVGAYDSWLGFLTNGASKVTAESVLVLRRDYTTGTDEDVAYKAAKSACDRYLYNIKAHLAIDLMGYTITRGSQHLFQIMSNAKSFSITVKNGYVGASGSAAIQFNDTGSSAVKTEINISFVDVTFLANENQKPIVVSHSGGTSVGYTANVTFNNCVFDTRGNTKTGIVLFDLDDKYDGDTTNKFDIKVVINGGKILMDYTSAPDVTLASIDGARNGIATDSIAFGIYNENFVNFVISKGETIKPFKYKTENGVDLSLVKISENSSWVTYTLKYTAAVSFVPKTSITLGSELVYNVYVPVVDYLKSFTVDGNAYGDAKIVTLSDGNQYYHVAVPMPASEAARNIVLNVTMTVDSKEYSGTFTMSIPKYSTKVLASDANQTEKILVKDVLSYIKAAYIYFDAEDKTAVVDTIDEILGDYNNTFAKVEGNTDADDGLRGVVIALEEKPVVRFVLPEGVTADGYIFKSGNTTLEYTVGTMTIGENTHYYAEVSLFAYQMINQITYTDGTNSGCYHINSYYDYVTKDDELKNDANLISLVEKLYNYCKSAEAYRASVTNK